MPDANAGHVGRYEYSFMAQGVELTAFVNVTPYYYPLMQPLPQVAFHTHEWYELFYVERGLLQCFFETETVELHAGQMLIVRPGVSHYALSQTADTQEYAFPFSFAAQKNCNAPWVRALDFPSYMLLPQDAECTALARFLISALQTDRAHAVGSYLFALLTRAADLSTERAADDHAPAGDSHMGRICRIERILQKYFNNSNLSMRFVAQELHMSVRQLARIIEKQYGCTYREKVLTLRMQHAVKLLRQGVSASQTAYEVGYSSVSAFHSAFVKYYGETPAACGRRKA